MTLALYDTHLFECVHAMCVQALIALAGSAAPAVRDRFMKLGVVAMLLREARPATCLPMPDTWQQLAQHCLIC